MIELIQPLTIDKEARVIFFFLFLFFIVPLVTNPENTRIFIQLHFLIFNQLNIGQVLTDVGAEVVYAMEHSSSSEVYASPSAGSSPGGPLDALFPSNHGHIARAVQQIVSPSLLPLAISPAKRCSGCWSPMFCKMAIACLCVCIVAVDDVGANGDNV